MEARIARIETHVEHLNVNVVDLRATAARVDKKIDDLGLRPDQKIDDLGLRLDRKIDDLGGRVEGRFAALDTRFDRHFLILGGMIVSVAIGLAGLMTKGFHWL